VFYRGIVLISIRTYLGVQNGTDHWKFSKYAVGIELEDGSVMDYKTGKIYNYIKRNDKGKLIANREDMNIKHTYAVECFEEELNKSSIYSSRRIERYIQNAEILTDEYKNIGKGPRLVKKR